MSTTSKAPTTILIVDDSPMVRQQVGRVLASAGFVIAEAKDGAEALEKLEASPKPALVFCDLNMPRMNGVEFLEYKRRVGSDVPVVMLSTEGHPRHVERAMELGAKAWLIKPFNPQHLLVTAQKLSGE
ncbi:MAG TPA: response regulator [Polyangiaceae bacterium]